MTIHRDGTVTLRGLYGNGGRLVTRRINLREVDYRAGYSLSPRDEARLNAACRRVGHEPHSDFPSGTA